MAAQQPDDEQRRAARARRSRPRGGGRSSLRVLAGTASSSGSAVNAAWPSADADRDEGDEERGRRPARRRRARGGRRWASSAASPASTAAARFRPTWRLVTGADSSPKHPHPPARRPGHEPDGHRRRRRRRRRRPRARSTVRRPRGRAAATTSSATPTTRARVVDPGRPAERSATAVGAGPPDLGQPGYSEERGDHEERSCG